MEKFYKDKRVAVTGGAGFIGRHLVDRLVGLGARVTVLDKKKNSFTDRRVRYRVCDLCDPKAAERLIGGAQVVFHLAADHGGRGYIHTHPADTCDNLLLTTNVVKAASRARAEKCIYASSACVYPTSLQPSYGSAYRLKEDDVLKNHGAHADEAYGWSKLMGEITLDAYRTQYGLPSAILRYVSVYGPGQDDSHAVMALVKRAAAREDPLVVWGTGHQDRDFCYVSDIVEGTILAGYLISDGTPINLGTSIRTALRDVVKLVVGAVGYSPVITFDSSRPEGVPTRALAIDRAKKLLGWSPRVYLPEGIAKTVSWYDKTHSA